LVEEDDVEEEEQETLRPRPLLKVSRRVYEDDVEEEEEEDEDEKMFRELRERRNRQ
jgi:hypothetical protein